MAIELPTQQWASFNQMLLNSFKQLNEAGLTTVNALLKNQLNMGQSAQLLQTTLNSIQDLNQVSTSTTNDALKQQINAVDLQTPINAVKEFTEISTVRFSNLINQQIELLNQSMAASVHCLETLKRASSSTEMMNIQSQLVTTLQDKVKMKAVETMLELQRLGSDIQVWTQNTLDNVIEASKEKETPKTTT